MIGKQKATEPLYYDRTVDESLLSLLRPGGALEWLPGFLRDRRGNLAKADLQLRRDRQRRRAGALQVYVGSTSILEIAAVPVPVPGETTVSLSVGAKAYRDLWDHELPRGRVRSDVLGQRRNVLEGYLERVAGSVTPRWLDKESRVHAGFMRRYGLCGGPSSGFLALDREVVIGHIDDEVRRTNRSRLQDDGYENNGRISSELDVLVVLPGGEAGLVELKEGPKGLPDAAAQVLTYLDRFTALRAQEGGNGLCGARKLLDQKVGAGLLPTAPCAGSFSGASRLRPIIAIPDVERGWPDRWIEVLEAFERKPPGLTLWRLSDFGEVLEERILFEPAQREG